MEQLHETGTTPAPAARDGGVESLTDPLPTPADVRFFLALRVLPSPLPQGPGTCFLRSLLFCAASRTWSEQSAGPSRLPLDYAVDFAHSRPCFRGADPSTAHSALPAHAAGELGAPRVTLTIAATYLSDFALVLLQRHQQDDESSAARAPGRLYVW